MGFPDALDKTMLTAHGLGHGPGGPVGGRALGFILGDAAQNLLPQPRLVFRLLATVVGSAHRIFDDARGSLRRIPIAPLPYFMRINPKHQTDLFVGVPDRGKKNNL